MTSPTDRAIRNGLALLTASLGREVDAIQVRAYLRGLGKVPADVVLEGADRCVELMAGQPLGQRYFPTVADWRAACAGVVDARRKAAARKAQALQEGCTTCHGSGWADVEGQNRVVRCPCTVRALELIAAAGEPMARSALPEHKEPVVDGAA